FAGVGEMVSSAVAAAGASFSDIQTIAVDIGPGSLSSVRAAVAYANGLAFSLGIAVFGANSLELMAAEAREIQPSPALCLRKGEAGNVYAGVFTDDRDGQLRYGPFQDTITALAGEHGKITVAGAHRQAVAALLAQAHVCDTGIEQPSVLTLYAMMRAQHDQPGRLVPIASPLNEGSMVFHE
ncbi:MAG TPA: tRNA (adenosine(37)-N6)-threonylcarbamoyltransferase complex dimerization subunit type 1 TsaB, partial [Streptosporangiaceae bacterium]